MRLAITPGGKKRRLDAAGLARSLRDLAATRQLDPLVTVREGCAGGCSRAGPNVGVTIHPVTPPDARPDHVAIGLKTYVYSLGSLDCVATIIDENLRARD